MAAATPNTGTSSANVANQTTDSNSNSTASTTTTDTTTYSTTTTTSTPTTTAMTKATSSPDPTTNSICKTSDSSKNNDSTDASSSTTSTNASNLNSGSNNQIKQQPKSQQQTVSDCRNSSSSSSSPPSPVTTKASSSSSDSTTIAASKTESEEGKTCGSKDVNSKNADVKPQQNSSNNENKTDNDDTIKLTKSSNEQSNDALKNNSNSNNNANECSNGSNSNNISNNNVVTSKSNALQAIPSVASTTAPTSSISSSGISNASSGSTHDHASGGDGNNFSQESNGPVGNRDIVSRNNNNARMDDDPQQHHHQQQQLQQHHHHQQQNSYQHHNKTSNQQQQQQQQHHHHHHHHNNQQQSHAHPNQHHHTHHHNEQLSKTNLYIKGLHADTSDHDLFSLCNRYGSIVSTKAILDKNTNKCKGYGFVDFETPASAEVAVVELQKQGILVHMAKQQEADPTNLYIVNLPQMMTESELEDLLKTYCPAGQVVSTRILINQNRQPRGVGFARMETKEQCDAIIASLNGQIIKGSKEPLLVKFADGASKKRVHHFQHKPLGANAFMGDHLWRNNSNDTNYHMMNSGPGNRNFHGGSFDHSRQNHSMSHHNNGLVKHQMMSSLSGYHPHHQGGHHTHTSAHHNHQQHHQSQLQHHHHGHNHSSHSSHRNQNQGLYTGGTAFPMSASMSGANDASQWLHPPQAGQPYVLQPQMLAPTSAIDPSLHYSLRYLNPFLDP